MVSNSSHENVKVSTNGDQKLVHFFLISNKNILKRRRVSPENTRSIRQGQKQIKCIKYKRP